MRKVFAAILALSMISLALDVAAQSSPRAGQWEGTFQVGYTNSSSVSGSNGSKADIDGAWGFGFGFAYNFNDHLSLGGDFSWAQADYTANVAPAAGNPNSGLSLRSTLETSSAHLSGTWNVLSSAFTPFVTAAVGATYVDTNIPSGPAVPVCWYDPWWGYYCGSTTPTHSQTDFSYNAGAGLRWDSPQRFFLRAMVARQWIDVGGAVGSPGFTMYRADIGFRF